MRSIYAGMMIGLGGMIFLMTNNKTIGSFLFSIGLLTIMILGLNLFTGKACDLKKYGKLNLPGIWIGNFIGALIMAEFTLGCKTHLLEDAAELTLLKLSKSNLTVFLDGVICNICIGIAVKGYKKAEGFGKYLIVVLAVMVFILVGSEHVVANMYYMTTGLLYLGVDYIGHVVLFMLFNTLGNLIGGILMGFIDFFPEPNAIGGNNNG